MSKFTPGPWKVDGHNTTAVIALMPHSEGTNHPLWQHVCSCDYGYADPGKHLEFNQANARLIAAAPEMYDLLGRMLAYRDQILPDTYKEIQQLLNRITQ